MNLVWERVEPWIEDAEGAVEGAYVDAISDGETDNDANFLQACRNGDKDRMKQILARVDVNVIEEGSGNTGKQINIIFRFEVT